MRFSVLFLFAVLLLVLLCSPVSSISLDKKGGKKGKGKGKAAAGKGSGSAAVEPGSGSGEAASAASEAAAEAQADAARQTVQASEEETKAADAILNGAIAEPDQQANAFNTRAYLSEQAQCNREMNLMPRRTAEEVQRARGNVRATDIIVPVPKSSKDGLAGLIEFHGALVKAGCRVTDHWCGNPGMCYFRTCFCTPVAAEAVKLGLVKAESGLKNTDKKLAVDAQIVKEAEVAAEDKGKAALGGKLGKKEKQIEKKLEKNAKVEKKLEKADAKVDQAAAKAQPASACSPGYKLIANEVPFCKKEVFQGAIGFENPEAGANAGFAVPPSIFSSVPAGYGGLSAYPAYAPVAYGY